MTAAAPLPVHMARYAMDQLDQAQRLALALEIVNRTTDYRCRFHLVRLELLARETAMQLGRADFIKRESTR